MQAVIELKGRINSSTGGRYFRTAKGGYYVSRSDIIDLIKEGDVVFHRGKGEERELLECLRNIETNTDGNIAMMNRILRNGGFVEYIKKLESKL